MDKSMDKSRVFGNLDLTKSQGLKTSWSFFVKFEKFEKNCTMLWHSLFDAVPGVVVPKLIFQRGAAIWI